MLLIAMDVLDVMFEESDLLLFADSLLNAAMSTIVFTPGMSCSIKACVVSTFASTKSYQRHWNTKHNPQNVIFHSPLMACHTSCLRRTDLIYHLRVLHLQTDSVESVLVKSRQEIQSNPNFIDPGNYKFVNFLPAPSIFPINYVACDPVSSSQLPLS